MCIDSLWKITVNNDYHNHDMAEDLSAYHEMRTLRDKDKKLVQKLTLAGATPHVIMATLQQQDPSVKLISRDVYNMHKIFRKEELDGRRPIEALLDNLQETDKIHQLKKIQKSD